MNERLARKELKKIKLSTQQASGGKTNKSSKELDRHSPPIVYSDFLHEDKDRLVKDCKKLD